MQKNQEKDEKSADLPTSPEKLLKELDRLGIDYKIHHHPAVFTVEESLSVTKHIPGAHCRNLYLRDRKKRNFLVVARNETEIDLKSLEKALECGRLSFGSADRLWQYLGVEPGSVCPFAVINDTDRTVRVVLDKSMMDHERVNFHPLKNTMTIGLSPEDLERFLEFTGHDSVVLDLQALKTTS